jgi:hypothetical protein
VMFVKDIDVKRDDADSLDWRDLDGCSWREKNVKNSRTRE